MGCDALKNYMFLEIHSGVFSMLCIISTTINYMHRLYFLYMLHYPVICSMSEIERERVAVNIQGTVFILARLRIVLSYHQEIYHIQY